MDYVAFSELCMINNTTPTALALKLGLSKGNTSSWKKGGNPSVDVLTKLADELNCTVDLLLGRNVISSNDNNFSENEKDLLSNFKKLSSISQAKVMERAKTLAEIDSEFKRKEGKKKNKEKDIEININYTYIDLYDMPVSAGTGIDLSGYSKEQIRVRESDEVEMADFCLRISGDSMEPDFHDGDMVLVKGCPTISIGAVGIFVVNGAGYIKELGCNKLISLNDEYEDIKLSENDSVWCMGEVIGTIDPEDIISTEEY